MALKMKFGAHGDSRTLPSKMSTSKKKKTKLKSPKQRKPKLPKLTSLGKMFNSYKG